MKEELPVVKGKVYQVGELKVLKNDFKKQEFLVERKKEWNGKEFSDIIKFVALGNATDSVSILSIGDDVEVGFDLSGRMWDSPDKGPINFTEAKAIYINKLNVVASIDPNETSSAQSQSAASNAVEEDDLPF